MCPTQTDDIARKMIAKAGYDYALRPLEDIRGVNKRYIITKPNLSLSNGKVPDIPFTMAVAQEFIQAGTTIGVFDGALRDGPDMYTLCIGKDLHVLNHTALVKINHSCEPNVAFLWEQNCFSEKGNTAQNLTFPSVVAMRDIAAGEEITFHYGTTEWELESPFLCACGKPTCVGSVLGYKHMTHEQRRACDGIVSPHIQRQALQHLRDTTLQEKPEKPIRVAVLTSSYEGCVTPLAQVDNYACTPEWYFMKKWEEGGKREFQFTTEKIKKNNSHAAVRALVISGKYDVFFNLCDGALDSDSAGLDVVQALDAFGAPFTGAVSRFYEPTKIDMKLLAAYAGLNIPPYFVMTLEDMNNSTPKTVESLCREAGISFPVMVKHPSGYGSFGMTKDSRCNNIEALMKQLELTVPAWGEVLVEAFIEGEEITVLAFEDECEMVPREGSFGKPTPGARTLAPIKMRFPPGESFKHFDLKWTSFDDIGWERVRDPRVATQARDVGKRAFQAILGGIGYGRTDIRVDRQGKMWFLEINPNCGLFYPPKFEGSADLILKLDGSVDGAEFARLMINAALRRQAERKMTAPPCRIVWRAASHLMVASRDIEEGEVVFRDEGEPLNVSSWNHINKSWKENDKRVLGRYGWPVNKESVVTWSENHRVWRPINHSCDPNLWFDEGHSRNVVARRAIQKGEELTMEYASFVQGDFVESYVCRCGSANCRGTVTGSDYTKYPEVREMLGTRTTSFVLEVYQETLKH